MLANGKKILISKNLRWQIAVQGYSVVDQVIVYTANQQSKDITYNTLTTARGEQSPYTLVLADGTKVLLNLRPLLVKSQSCGTIYDAAVVLSAQGKYDLALKRLAGYKLCAPEQAKRADLLILKIYQTINDQKNQAVTQRKLATRRAMTISAQKDSNQNENMANIFATQALQLNQTDPTTAIQYVYAGLCFAPQNPSLTEIRKNILNNEVIRANLPGAGRFATNWIQRLSSRLLVTSDTEGYLRFWEAEGKKLNHRYRVFKGAITACTVIDSSRVLVAGRNHTDPGNHINQLKLVDTAGNVKLLVADLTDPLLFLACLNSTGKAYAANSRGVVSELDLAGGSHVIIRKDSSGIVGLQAYNAAKKIFYATPRGVYELLSEKLVYQPNSFAATTALGLCPANGDLYICSGRDIIQYNYFTRKDRPLYPIHQHLVSSCHCDALSGDFLSTDLNGLAVQWNAAGSLKNTLKGNKGELLDGYLSPGAGYALTAGRKEMNNVVDTITLKYWYLNGFLKNAVSEAHRFGATSVVYAVGRDMFITGGMDDQLKLWDRDLHLLDIRKIGGTGIGPLAWDEQRGAVIFGDLSGRTGSLKVGSQGNFGMLNILQGKQIPVAGIAVDRGMIYTTSRNGILYSYNGNGAKTDSVFFDRELGAVSLSRDGGRAALVAGKDVFIYEFKTKIKRGLPHVVRVNAVSWLAPDRLVTLSGQFLYIWDTGHRDAPLLKINNNIQNEMNALCVDEEHRMIYSGTKKGYIICWDYGGKQLFEFDQLGSLAPPSIVQDLALDGQHTRLLAVDYNGSPAAFYTPPYFLGTILQTGINCQLLLKQLK